MVKARKSPPADAKKPKAVAPTLDEIDVSVLENGDERWRDEIAGKASDGGGRGGGGVRDPPKRGGLRTSHRRGRRWRRGARSGARGGASYFWGRAPSAVFLRAPPSAP